MNARAYLVDISKDDRERCCQRLAEAHPDCDCEKMSAGNGLSPGLLAGDETLIRICPSPIYWDDAADEPKASAFDDVTSKSMSVVRDRYITRAGLNKQISQRLKADRRPGGLVSSTPDTIKAIEQDSRRVFCIYDTSIEGNRPHADVCQTFYQEAGSKAFNRLMRRQLQKAFTKYEHTFDPENVSDDDGFVASPSSGQTS